jgi:hypothetical protein
MTWIKSTHNTVLGIAQNKKKQQEFLWLFAFITILIFSYDWYYKGNYNYGSVLIGFTLLLISFIYSKPAYPLLYLWLFFGNILSEITSFIILSIIFYLGMVPIKFLQKKENISKGWNNVKESSNFDEQF